MGPGKALVLLKQSSGKKSGTSPTYAEMQTKGVLILKDINALQ